MRKLFILLALVSFNVMAQPYCTKSCYATESGFVECYESCVPGAG